MVGPSSRKSDKRIANSMLRDLISLPFEWCSAEQPPPRPLAAPILDTKMANIHRAHPL